MHTDTGEEFRLSDLKGKRVVLYFYPQGRYARMHRGSLRVSRRDQGISRRRARRWWASRRTSPRAQAKFKQKYDLPFTLLADEEKAAAEAYGVWKEKNMYGKKVMGIARTTFVIGPDGKIEKIYGNVKAQGHAAQVLADIG